MYVTSRLSYLETNVTANKSTYTQYNFRGYYIKVRRHDVGSSAYTLGAA